MLRITQLNVAHCSAEFQVTVITATISQSPEVFTIWNEHISRGGWRYGGAARQHTVFVEGKEHQTHGGCHCSFLVLWRHGGGRAASQRAGKDKIVEWPNWLIPITSSQATTALTPGKEVQVAQMLMKRLRGSSWGGWWTLNFTVCCTGEMFTRGYFLGL